MSTIAENSIKSCEVSRLTDLGIPYDRVHVTEDRPVVKIDGKTMSKIISDRCKGIDVGGLFVSEDEKGEWTASWVDLFGEAHYLKRVTIAIAYKAVLGYSTGRQHRSGRYTGYVPYHRENYYDDEF